MEYSQYLTLDLSNFLDQEGFGDRWNFLNHNGNRIEDELSRSWNLPKNFVYDNFKLFILYSIARDFNIRGKISFIKLMRSVFKIGLKESKFGTEFLGEDGYLEGHKGIKDKNFQINYPDVERGIIGDGITDKSRNYCKVFETLCPDIIDECMFETAKALLDLDLEFKPQYENILRRIFPRDWENVKN